MVCHGVKWTLTLRRNLPLIPNRKLKGNPLKWILSFAVDLLADNQFEISSRPPPKVLLPAICTSIVYLNGSNVYVSIYNILTLHTHSPSLGQYLCTNFHWTTQQLHMIYWDAMDALIKTVSPSKKTNIIILVIGK